MIIGDDDAEAGILTGIRIVDISQDLAGPMATRLLAEAGAQVIKVESPEGDPAPRSWDRFSQDYPSRAPLEGLRVLDFGMFLAGPFGTQCLADMGANVVKVEPPTGDRMRGSAQLFVGCQRNKRSIAIDLGNPASRPLLERLVRWADVVHHNLRAPAAARLRLDYESIRVVNPDVIYCHVSTYGPQGMMRDWPGVDHDGMAASGWMWDGSGEGNPPIWYLWGFMDFQCALSSLVATLLGLYRREVTGEGSRVSASLLGAAVNTTDRILLADGTVADTPRLNQDQTGTSPGYRIYKSADGWVAVAADLNSSLDAMRRVLGVDLDDELPSAFVVRSTADLCRELATAGVPVDHVALDQRLPFFDSADNHRLQYAVTYKHPEYGWFDQPGAYWSFGDLEVRLDGPPPTIGQHSRQILDAIGMSGSEIDSLVEAGVVVAAE